MTIPEPSTRKPMPISPTIPSVRGYAKKVFSDATTAKVRAVFSAEVPALSGGVVCTEDVQSDVSWGMRAFMDAPVAPDSITQQVMGVTTGVNAFQGWFAYKQAKQRLSQATQLEDTTGKIESRIDAVRGVAQGIGGAAFLGFRGVQTGVYVQTALGHAKVAGTVKLAAAGTALGVAGSGLFAAFFGAIGVWGGFKLYKDYQFKKAYEAAAEKGEAALFEFLTKRALIDSRKECAKLKETSIAKSVNEKKKFREKIRKEALDALVAIKMRSTGEKDAAQTRAAIEVFFDQNREELKNSPEYKAYLSQMGLTEEDVKGLDYSLLEIIGFFIEEQRRQGRKDVKLARLTSVGCVEAIKKAAARGLGERLKSPDGLTRGIASLELRSIKVEETTKNNRILNIVLVATGIFGVVSMAIGLLPFVWAPMAAFAVCILLVGLMLYVDSKCAQNGLAAVGPVGSLDRKYAIAIGVLAVASLILSGGITGVLVGLGYLSAAHLLPLIPAAFIAIMGVGFSVRACRKLNAKEEKYKADHPNLHQVARGEAQFKKLLKVDRLAVRAAFQETLKNADMGENSPKELAPSKWTEEERRLMIKAFKKSWKFYALDPAPESKSIATLMRVLLDTTLQLSEENDRKNALALEALEKEGVAFEHFRQDVLYVFARERSAEAFTQVVQDVASKKLRAVAEHNTAKLRLQGEIKALEKELLDDLPQDAGAFFHQKDQQALRALQEKMDALELSAAKSGFKRSHAFGFFQ